MPTPKINIYLFSAIQLFNIYAILIFCVNSEVVFLFLF